LKIKTKLRLNVGVLFLLILLLVFVGSAYIIALKNDTEKILVANYKSLAYSRSMLISLEDTTEFSIQSFEYNLQKQEKNITEEGEKESTKQVRVNFKALKNNLSNLTLIKQIRQDLLVLMAINMQAIQHKNDIAKATAKNALFWIFLTGTLCLAIASLLLIILPSNITNPINKLTESIKQIASKKYSERVQIDKHSEFTELAYSFNKMAQKLEEYDNSNLAVLMKEKKRIETLINNMYDPLVGLDENLNILFANTEAIKIIGMAKHEIIGKNAQELANKKELIRILIQDLNKNENNIQLKPIKIHSNNKEGYFEKETLPISIIPTGEHTAQLIGHVVILRNVTGYKELYFAKTNFIATISHEFKTPISAIKMSLQLLENDKIGPLNMEQKNLIESIKDDASRLLKFTAELLNMTQVESGNIQLSIIPCDPKEIILYAINATQTQATQKQIKFNLNCPDSIAKIQADNEKTAWVLTNLISNAIRYSYDNSTILIKAQTIEKKVHISVTDSGQGIAPQYLDKIFERYFRVPGTKKEGTGLGLSISKEFIEAQNGQIKLESELGKGSTFTVVLNAVA
jgi:PAS domain S-box-containing protein